MEAPGSLLHPTFDNVMGFLGLVLGLAGIWYAVRAEHKLQKVREAKKQVERRFMRTMALQEFGKIENRASAIVRAARDSDWEALANLADEAGTALLNARSARGRLLEARQSDQLDAAVSAMEYCNSLLPLREDEEVDLERAQQLVSACLAVKNVSSEHSGHFEVESEEQEERYEYSSRADLPDC